MSVILTILGVLLDIGLGALALRLTRSLEKSQITQDGLITQQGALLKELVAVTRDHEGRIVVLEYRSKGVV